MGKLASLLALCLVLSANALWTGEPNEVSTKGGTVESILKKKVASTPNGDSYKKFHFGGYEGVVANFKDYGIDRFLGGNRGSPGDHRSTIAIPRFVLAFDYGFNSKWILGAGIEFEPGDTGTAVGLENSENGGYEAKVEKGDEVALKQFHTTRLIHPAFNVRAGHLIVPVDLTNAHHEPVDSFGAYRPEGKTIILPSIWHKTDIEFFGFFGRGYTTFDYQALVVVGLNANGFDRNNQVTGGKWDFFEVDNFTSPAYVTRLDCRGVPDLRMGNSFYYCVNTASSSDRVATCAGVKTPLCIYTADGQYKSEYVVARANFVFSNLTGATAINNRDKGLSNSSPYIYVVQVVEGTMSYVGEVGVNLRSIYNDSKRVPIIHPSARYEYYSPREERERDQLPMDKRNQVSIWTAGLSWYALPNLVVKAGHMTHQIGTGKVFDKGRYNGENEFSVGIVYVDWFVKK